MSLLPPVYSTIAKGPRAGSKIINWPATAARHEKFNESLNENFNALNEQHSVAMRHIDSLTTEQTRCHSALRTLSSHWTSIFWPKSFWSIIRSCGVNV